MLVHRTHAKHRALGYHLSHHQTGIIPSVCFVNCRKSDQKNMNQVLPLQTETAVLASSEPYYSD